jgi:hypothetical protein
VPPRTLSSTHSSQYTMLTFALLVWLTTSAVAQEITTASGPTTSQDFGTVKAGTVVTQTFAVSRPAPGASVERVELSQRGMTARLIPAGDHDDRLGLRVTWDTTLLDGRVESETTVHWTDPSQAPRRLMLTGTVTPVIALEPFAAVFFSVYQDEGGERAIKIVNRDDRQLEITRLEPLGKHFTAAVRTLVEGQEYALVVRVAAGTELGRFQEALVVHTNQPTRPKVPVAVNVLVKPDLYASPEVVDFGQVDLEQLRRAPALRDALTQVVGIKRRQGAFVITSVETDIPGLDVVLSPSRPTETFRMDVRLVPAQMERGMVNGAIRLRTNDPIFPEVVVPVRGEIR